MTSVWSASERLPLAGLVVIDFGQIFQGPYATFLLAKGGADVIKIEPPGGEPLRRRALPEKQATLPFAMLNQNKRAVTLNLKHPRGRELLFAMVTRADVLLENFSPGTMDDLGVGWSVLRELNPRLVYATGTGFGISGPDRDNLAMDLTIQAASGIMSVTGAPDGPPMKAGPTLVDFMGGIHLYAGILTALYERDRSDSGEPGGRLVEVAMQETVYPSLAASFEYYHRTGQPPPRTGNRQAGLSTAPYNVYPAADGHVRDPHRHRGALAQPAEGDGARGIGRRPAFRDQRRPHRPYGRDRHGGRRMDAQLAEDGSLRPPEIEPGAERAGAHRARDHARPAHARARHAAPCRAPRIGADRRADLALAAARQPEAADAAEPQDRPAQ